MRHFRRRVCPVFAEFRVGVTGGRFEWAAAVGARRSRPCAGVVSFRYAPVNAGGCPRVRSHALHEFCCAVLNAFVAAVAAVSGSLLVGGVGGGCSRVRDGRRRVAAGPLPSVASIFGPPVERRCGRDRTGRMCRRID